MKYHFKLHIFPHLKVKTWKAFETYFVTRLSFYTPWEPWEQFYPHWHTLDIYCKVQVQAPFPTNPKPNQVPNERKNRGLKGFRAATKFRVTWSALMAYTGRYTEESQIIWDQNMQICVVAWGRGRWNNLTFYHPTWEMCHYKICLNSYYYFGGCAEMTIYLLDNFVT